MTPLAFAPGIDPDALAAGFRATGRLHLPGVFPDDQARAIHAALVGAPFSKSVLVNGKAYDIGLETLAAMPAERRAELQATVSRGAREGFQYQFDAWRLSDVVERGEAEDEPLKAVYDFLNGPSFLAFIHALSGDERAAYVDAQATRYRAGDFLTVHDDDVDGKHRLFAYVLNFTPVWKLDWGGLLLFHDALGHVEAGFTPTFNALNLFRVPQKHSVTEVASYVSADRLSITGWIRERR